MHRIKPTSLWYVRFETRRIFPKIPWRALGCKFPSFKQLPTASKSTNQYPVFSRPTCDELVIYVAIAAGYSNHITKFEILDAKAIVTTCIGNIVYPTNWKSHSNEYKKITVTSSSAKKSKTPTLQCIIESFMRRKCIFSDRSRSQWESNCDLYAFAFSSVSCREVYLPSKQWSALCGVDYD